MTKQELFKFMNDHPIFQLATCEGDKPRIRHMLLYKANDEGLFFYTGFNKDVCTQIFENHNVELCFYDLATFTQVRVRGIAILVHDNSIKHEIQAHPMHGYLKRVKEIVGKTDYYENFTVFQLINGEALVWKLENNYNTIENYSKDYINLWD